MNRTAILATAIPPTLFAVTSIILTLLLSPELIKTEGLNIVDNCLQVSIGLLGIALISIIVFAVRRKREIAKGIAAGFGIGFVVWAGSFIAVSLLYEFWL